MTNAQVPRINLLLFILIVAVAPVACQEASHTPAPPSSQPVATDAQTVLTSTVEQSQALRQALSKTASISVTRLRQHVEYLAHPKREGRGVNTKGLQDAADYLVGQFKALGLSPAFQGSYRQAFEMIEIGIQEL